MTPQGKILLNGGFAETPRLIEANVEKPGFKLKDAQTPL